MRFDLKQGDRALVLYEQSLGYGGHLHVALISEVERVTPTRVIVRGVQYRKDDGSCVGGKGRLVDNDNPEHHDHPIDVLTEKEVRSLYTEWSLFDATIRGVLGRQSSAQSIGSMFCDKELRKSVLDAARRYEDEMTELINTTKTR